MSLSRLAPLVLLALVLGGCRDEADPAILPPPDPGASPAGDVPTYTGDFALVDDGVEVPGFETFRDTLRSIAGRRDTTALLGVVAPGARLSFGDTAGGPAGFRAMWFSGDPPTDEPVWDVLHHAVDGGSVDEDGAVTFPFVSGLWPSDTDPFAYVAVLNEYVPAYDQPGGGLVAHVTQLIVPVLAPPLDGWWQVSLPDSEAAFVAADDVYSPVGYRAVAWDDGDGWRLRSFLAGD